MNFKKDIKPISFFKSHAAEVIKNLNETHGTMIITQHGEAKAIIQDITEYERIQEALALLKMAAEGQKDFKEGNTISAAEMIDELRALTVEDAEK
ncbi:type II toxin-antitoxin system Phd/YefM family antitoxin [uncultured Desulfosarcina sp.]|uniref:type II toxin-antitoxin system Phd/YefM family antitoxin n=1 Tax=uncultured Desulfosarcina sp. TaxID=218289 RepID=UPI0029C704D6|nr:type II toxin-antitoxin system Phd/YefM family antitoxin [uncultured Desulfosarcina sp.]